VIVVTAVTTINLPPVVYSIPSQKWIIQVNEYKSWSQLYGSWIHYLLVESVPFTNKLSVRFPLTKNC
jgi:hypothetical protein